MTRITTNDNTEIPLMEVEEHQLSDGKRLWLVINNEFNLAQPELYENKEEAEERMKFILDLEKITEVYDNERRKYY